MSHTFRQLVQATEIHEPDSKVARIRNSHISLNATPQTSRRDMTFNTLGSQACVWLDGGLATEKPRSTNSASGHSLFTPPTEVQRQCSYLLHRKYRQRFRFHCTAIPYSHMDSTYLHCNMQTTYHNFPRFLGLA